MLQARQLTYPNLCVTLIFKSYTGCFLRTLDEDLGIGYPLVAPAFDATVHRWNHPAVVSPSAPLSQGHSLSQCTPYFYITYSLTCCCYYSASAQPATLLQFRHSVACGFQPLILVFKHYSRSLFSKGLHSFIITVFSPVLGHGRLRA